MSVPDHLIEKAAEAIHGPSAHDLPELRHQQARRALSAVADELRAEGAKAEREKIADALAEDARVALSVGDAYSASVLRRAASDVREGVRDAT